MPERPTPPELNRLAEKPGKKEADIIPVTIWERDIRNMVAAAAEQGEEAKPFMFRSLRDLTASVYRGKEEQLTAAFTDLESRDYKSEQELISTVAAEMYKFGQENLTPRELEANIRMYVVDRTEHVINDMLHYEVYKDALYLHVFPVSTLSAGEKLKLLRDGLKQLARQLKTDEHLKGVKTVNGVSWIVAQNPGLMEKLGFTYDGEITKEEHERDFSYETRKVGKAHIDVEKFLELHSA